LEVNVEQALTAVHFFPLPTNPSLHTHAETFAAEALLEFVLVVHRASRLQLASWLALQPAPAVQVVPSPE
jgi:hypothetical protein